MRRKWNKGALTLTMALTLICISACGNQPSADVLDNETEIEESTIETETIESEEETDENESSESEEIEPIEIASGHLHNIDMEEKMKEIDTEEEEREEEVQITQTTATEKKEAEVQTQTPSTETTTAPTAEQTASSVIGTIPDMSTLEEWVPAIPMTVVYTTQVKDSDGNNLGEILEGSSIGVSGKCGNGWYQVNYGAKRSFLPMDCLKQ